MVPSLRNSQPVYMYVVIQGNSTGTLFDGSESTHCVVTLALWIHWCLKWPKK